VQLANEHTDSHSFHPGDGINESVDGFICQAADFFLFGRLSIGETLAVLK